MTEEEKGEFHEVNRSLMDSFKEKPYIYKEVIRIVQTRTEEIKFEDMSATSNVGRFPFLCQETFQSSKITLVDNCGSLNCFYIDFNNCLQKISIPEAEFTKRSALEET